MAPRIGVEPMTDNPMSSAHRKCRRTVIKRSGQEADCREKFTFGLYSGTLPDRESMASNSGVTDLAAILDAKWSLARERTEAIRPLIERQSFDRAAVMRRAVECGVHTATLYRWLDRYCHFSQLLRLIRIHATVIHDSCDCDACDGLRIFSRS